MENDLMDYDDYPNENSWRSPGVFTVVLISFATSTLVTLTVLWSSGNLSSINTNRQQLEQTAGSTELGIMVPSLVGLPTKSAIDLLRARNLRIVVSSNRHDKTAAKGIIVEQTPLPDSELKIGEEVAVVVSAGPKQVTVPQIIGKSIEEAKTLIKAAGIEIGNISNTGNGSPGSVTQVMPHPGAAITEGKKIDLVIAPLGVEVPSLIGMSTHKARKIIKKTGFKVGKTRWRYNEYKPANIVLSQKPSAGSKAAPNSEVNLVINEE